MLWCSGINPDIRQKTNINTEGQPASLFKQIEIQE